MLGVANDVIRRNYPMSHKAILGTLYCVSLVGMEMSHPILLEQSIVCYRFFCRNDIGVISRL